MKKDDGDYIEVEKPCVFFCVRCSKALPSCFPYLDLERIKNSVVESPSFKSIALDAVSSYHDESLRPPEGQEHVFLDSGTCDQIRLLFDGFERKQFITRYQGCTPEELDVSPTTAEHPVTGEDTDVYFVEGEPHWQLTTSGYVATKRRQDLMLQQIYNLQGEHTAKYHSSRLDSINRKINKQPPPRHILQQRMKEVLEKKKAGRAQPAIKAESGVNSSESDAGLPFARPAAARSAEQPVKLEAKSSAASSVRFTTAPTAPVLQAHAAKASSRSALDDARQSLGLTPLSQARRPKVESTAVPKDPPQVLKVELSPVRGSLKRSALTSSLPVTTIVKRARVKLAAGTSASASGLSRFAGLNVVDLAKQQPTQFDQQSEVDSEEGGNGNKFERALGKCPMNKVLRGENIEAELVQLRKMNSTASKESPTLYAPKIAGRLTQCAGGKELVMAQMMQRNSSFQKITEIVQSLEPSLEPYGGKLPKSNWCDYRIVHAAMSTIPPWKATPDFKALLDHLRLHHDGFNSEYNLASPSWFIEYIDKEDLQNGVVPRQWVSFFEKYILSAYIINGVKNQCMVVAFVNDHFVPYLESLPSEYTAPCLQECLRRAKGLLWTLGPVPFMRGASASDAAALKERGNPVCEAVANTPWAKALMDVCNYRSLGEKTAWPQVLAAVADLSSEDAAKEHSAIDAIVQSHAAWAKQCRKPALPHYLYPVVTKHFEVKLKCKLITEEKGSEPRYDPSDSEIVAILESIKRIKTLNWQEPKLDQMLADLRHVAVSLQARDDLSVLVRACEFDPAAAALDASSLQQFEERLSNAIPAPPGNVLVSGEARAKVLPILFDYSQLALRSFPGRSTTQAAVIAVLDRVEFQADPDIQIGGKPIKSAIADVIIRLRTFRRMRGFHNNFTEAEKLGTLSAEVVENPTNVTIAKKLILYLDHFEGPEFSRELIPSDVLESFQAVLTTCSKWISEFKCFYFSNSSGPFERATSGLALIAGGTTNASRWSDKMVAGIKWAEFLVVTKSTLRSVDKTKLILAIKETDQALRP